jgi:DNA-binding ferritin-like protein
MEMEKMMERLLARMEPIRSELEGSIQHGMKSVLSYVDHKTHNLVRELADAIEKTRWNYRQQGCPSTHRHRTARDR